MIGEQISNFRKERFKHRGETQRLIRKLVSHQNKNGSWCWWGTDKDGSLWITLHVAEALKQAEQGGYFVAYDKQALLTYVQKEMNSAITENKARALMFLLESGEKPVIDDLVGAIMDSGSSSTTHLKLVAQRIKQLAGQSPDWLWIDSLQQKTIKENYYWGEESKDLFDNSILNTLLVYKCKEAVDAKDQELVRIRNFFLEKRKRNWRNTYESSLIAEAILPSLLRDKEKSDTRLKVELTGGINTIINEFPFETEYEGAAPLSIKKSGQSPVYFTAFQEFWNSTPKAVSKDFEVRTQFAQKG
jgi:hypothetical protein